MNIIFFLFSDHSMAILRGVVIERLGLVGHKETVEKAKKLFEAHCGDPVGKAILTDIRPGVYSIVLSNGGEAAFDQLLNVLLLI